MSGRKILPLEMWSSIGSGILTLLFCFIPSLCFAGAFLGVAMSNPPEDWLDARGNPVRGAYVMKVLTPSPAAEAGIKTGDLIVRFGKKTIVTIEEMSLQVASMKVDDDVRVGVLRRPSAKPVYVRVKLGKAEDYLKEEIPPPAAENSASPYTPLRAGDTAPDFAAVDVAGREFRLSDYRGKWVFLDFWAVWCVPCIVEIPYLIEAHKKFSGKPIEFVSISLDESREQLERFTNDHGLPFRQVFSGLVWSDPVARLYDVQGIPLNFLIDPAGRIAAMDLRRGRILKKLSAIFVEPKE